MWMAAPDAPSCRGDVAGDPQCQTRFFAVGRERVFLCGGGFGIEAVDMAEFIHGQVADLAVDVVGERFESAEQQRLAHDAKVGAERIEQPDAVVELHLLQVGVV